MFVPSIIRGFKVIAAAAVLTLALLALQHYWGLRGENARLRQTVCDWRLRALVAATPALGNLSRPVDACAALRVLVDPRR